MVSITHFLLSILLLPLLANALASQVCPGYEPGGPLEVTDWQDLKLETWPSLNPIDIKTTEKAIYFSTVNYFVKLNKFSGELIWGTDLGSVDIYPSPSDQLVFARKAGISFLISVNATNGVLKHKKIRMTGYNNWFDFKQIKTDNVDVNSNKVLILGTQNIDLAVTANSEVDYLFVGVLDYELNYVTYRIHDLTTAQGTYAKWISEE